MEHNYEIVETQYDEYSNSISITLNLFNQKTDSKKQDVHTYRNVEGNTFLEKVFLQLNIESYEGNIYNSDLIKK